MPQGNENVGAIDAASLNDEQSRTKILDKDGIDDLDHRCKEDSNRMPELKDDQDQANDEEVCLDLSEPSAEVMDYARRELGETEEVRCRTLQELRDMIYGNFWIFLQ